MSDLAGGTRLDGAGTRHPARWNELRSRIVSALVLMAAALGTAFSGGLLFDALWLLASLEILWEWLRLVGGPRRMARFLVGATAMLCATGAGVVGHPLEAIVMLAGGGVVVGLVSPPGTPIVSALGPVYAGSLILSVAVLRASSGFGMRAILFLFAVVWGTDCMAYFGGRLIGGPKLAPRLSPSKTWSGFLVGVVAGSLFGWLVSPASARLDCMLVLGLATGSVAQGGDILESLLKRRFKVKDAGNLIPGHGGLMDRLDGFIAASVFVAILGIARAGVGAASGGVFQW